MKTRVRKPRTVTIELSDAEASAIKRAGTRTTKREDRRHFERNGASTQDADTLALALTELVVACAE